MSNRLPENGLVEFSVPASDVIAVFSRAPCKVFTRAGYPNFPESWSLLQDVAADAEYVSAAFTAATDVRIEAGPADVLYANGTAAVILERRALRGQGTPGVLNATGTLTAAMIASGIVTSTTAAAVTAAPSTCTPPVGSPTSGPDTPDSRPSPSRVGRYYRRTTHDRHDCAERRETPGAVP